MEFRDAWLVLSVDFSEIEREIKSMPSKEAKKKYLIELKEKSQKIGKKLLSVHHPDRNMDDPSSDKRFKMVAKAMEVIEKITDELINTPNEDTRNKKPMLEFDF
jgi:hypothetical protein